MKQEETNFSLKDELFNKEKVAYLASFIKSVYPKFCDEDFTKEVVSKFPELELMDRAHHITHMLGKFLIKKESGELDFLASLEILVKSLPEELDPNNTDNDFGDFILAPYSDFLAVYGIEYIKTYTYSSGVKEVLLSKCFDAFEEITKRFSAELSIRHFFNAFPEETLSQFLLWSKNKNYHVRRLSSEGSRAKLPWACKIEIDYRKTISILDNLYSDNTRYVTRSVANHLNDIAKIDPDLVIDTLERWQKNIGVAGMLPLQENDLDYIISHSTRTLIKQGNVRTLEFLGYSSNPKVILEKLHIKNTDIKIGESLEFSFQISLEKPEKLIIDYKIYFLNKKGLLQPKVFKLKKGIFTGEDSCEKKHPLRLMTTKALYPGTHLIEIIFNGKSAGKKEFELKE